MRFPPNTQATKVIFMLTYYIHIADYMIVPHDHAFSGTVTMSAATAHVATSMEAARLSNVDCAPYSTICIQIFKENNNGGDTIPILWKYIEAYKTSKQHRAQRCFNNHQYHVDPFESHQCSTDLLVQPNSRRKNGRMSTFLK
jgi:hypothetical protein